LTVSPTFADGFDRASNASLGGAWTERQGDFAISANRALGQAALNLATVNGVSLANVAVSADVVLPVANGASVALIARRGASGNMYFANVYRQNGVFKATLYRVYNGKTAALATKSLPGFSGSANLRFTAVGRNLMLAING